MQQELSAAGRVTTLRIYPRDLKAISADQLVVDRIIAGMVHAGAEVDMELTGTPVVAAKMRGTKKVGEIPVEFERIIDTLEGYIIEPLELFIPE